VSKIFDFGLSVVSLPSEWSWAIRLSAASVVAPDSRKAINLSENGAHTKHNTEDPV
jgi:hypothetical protein